MLAYGGDVATVTDTHTVSEWDMLLVLLWAAHVIDCEGVADGR